LTKKKRLDPKEGFVANFELLTLENGKPKRQKSDQISVDFSSLAIGVDGLSIVQGGAGSGAYFDFNSRALRSSRSPEDGSDLVNKNFIENVISTLEPKVEVRTIEQFEVNQKFITLQSAIGQPSLTKFHFINGTTQIINIDYKIENGNVISWEGLGLDGFIEAGDIVRIEYF
jgi:hypothetical protein